LPHLQVEAGSFLVFDKAYYAYLQFANELASEFWFVTRMKKNAVFHVRKVIIDNTKKQNVKGVIKKQYVSVTYKDNGMIDKAHLRRITFKDDHGRIYLFITNNFKISAPPVALVYKHRWMIESLQADQTKLSPHLFLGRE
jgi:IS4 transposase